MRMNKTHKVAMTAVVTTIATATVLTFTRSDTAAADRIATVPKAGNDAPIVARRDPAPKPKPKPSPDKTTPSPEATDPATQAPKPVAKPKPTKTTAKPSPTTQPTPSPTPTPRKKSLLEFLLGL
ncbi:hypothetical protein [Aeromicrobium sp. Root236]|uniref:hypothetical protein n=1 Tax=Aeromicrobium sp. Root236 TaxID=1736498 RepID=UPI000A89D515|nr:hypothetical protein [Aeromicrobium sp. Root236]